MTEIKKIIQDIIYKFSFSNGYKKAWLDKYWLELAGVEAGKHSRPLRVDRDILFVIVDSSVWNQEMFMTRTKLIEKINRKFTRKIIEDVKYHVGTFAVLSEKGVSQETMPLPEIIVQEPRRDVAWDENVLMRLRRKKMCP